MDNAAPITRRIFDEAIQPKNPKGSIFTDDDLLRVRDRDAGRREVDGCLSDAAASTLRLVDQEAFASRVREVFASIPAAALSINLSESEIETFRRAVKISLALMVFAARGGQRDLHHIIKSLHLGVLALEERIRGVDEPFFRARRSPRSAREDPYMKCVKTWCAIAAHALVLMRCPKKEAARCVAEVVNKQKFLLPKRSGISVDPRSVLNWMARWDDGDLKVFNDGWCAFHEAFDLFNQGQPRAARHKLLNVLSDLLDERRNFQMYPEETGSVS